MLQQIFEKKIIKGLAAAMLILNSVVLILTLHMTRENSLAIKEVHQEIVVLKSTVEEEIKLREELFTTLLKSASLLKKYNTRLDGLTAFKYACKIYDCSEKPITPELLTALIVVESGANHIAVSDKGAIGLTQVVPHIGKYHEKELLNPYKNIEIGSKILKYHMDKHGIIGGLSTYNSGDNRSSLGFADYVLEIAQNLQQRSF